MSTFDAELEQQYAEVLDSCLEQLSLGTALDSLLAANPEFAHRLQIDLEMAVWLSQQKEAFAPRAGFLEQSRNELLSQLKTSKPSEPALGWTEFWRWLVGSRFAFRLATALVILVVIMGSLSGVAYAAQSSIPGDSLYSLKLSIEDARLTISSDPVNDADLFLAFANERLNEMDRLIAQQRLDLLDVSAARYEEQMRAALQVLDQVGENGTANQQDRALTVLMDVSLRLDQHAQQMALFSKSLGVGQEKALDTAIQTLQELQLVSHGLNDEFNIDLGSGDGISATDVVKPEKPSSDNPAIQPEDDSKEPPGPAVATSRAETRTAEPEVEVQTTVTPKDKENSKPASPPGLDQDDDKKEKPEKPTKKPKPDDPNPNKPPKEEDK